MRGRYKELSLQQLRTLRELCLGGTYADVARRLDLSTSAVWEQMRGLEKFVGLTLLENRDGRMQPTFEGRRLLELVDPHVAGLDAAREALHQLRGRAPERITFVSGIRMLTDEVARAVARFKLRYPDVLVRLLYAPDHQIDAIIGRGEADLGLMIERADATGARGVNPREPAYELDFVLATTRQHPLASKRSLRLADLVKHPLIVGAQGTATRSWIDQVFHRSNLTDRIRIAVESNSSNITFAAVQAGIGIGITASPLQGSLTRDLAIRSLGRWFGKARFTFVWGRGIDRLPIQQALAGLIRTCASS